MPVSTAPNQLSKTTVLLFEKKNWQDNSLSPTPNLHGYTANEWRKLHDPQG